MVVFVPTFIRWGAPRPPIHLRDAQLAVRSTLIHLTSSLNGPAFVSPSRKPRALTSVGSTGPASRSGLPNEVASNLSNGSLASILPHPRSTVRRPATAATAIAAYCTGPGVAWQLAGVSAFRLPSKWNRASVAASCFKCFSGKKALS